MTTTTSDPQPATSRRRTGSPTGTWRAPTVLGGRGARPGPALSVLLVADGVSPSPTSIAYVPTPADGRSTGPLHAAPTAARGTSRRDHGRTRSAA